MQKILELTHHLLMHLLYILDIKGESCRNTMRFVTFWNSIARLFEFVELCHIRIWNDTIQLLNSQSY